MLMALPLGIGYLCATVARTTRRLKPGWRNHLLWLSSPDASEIIAAAFAVALMALSVLLSMSRSGLIGLLASLAISGWLIVRRRSNGSSPAVIAAYLLFVVLAAGAWAGFDRIAARFAGNESSLDGRIGIWTDTLRFAQRFPLTGTGVNTYSTATLFYQTVYLDKHYDTAHNDYLQLLAEGGLLVCVPAVLAIFVFARTVRRRFAESSPEGTSYWIRAGAVTGIAVIALQETIDFSLQIPGNALLFTVLLAIAVRQPSRR
jgi:O-antigen ligase